MPAQRRLKEKSVGDSYIMYHFSPSVFESLSLSSAATESKNHATHAICLRSTSVLHHASSRHHTPSHDASAHTHTHQFTSVPSQLDGDGDDVLDAKRGALQHEAPPALQRAPLALRPLLRVRDQGLPLFLFFSLTF